MEMSSRERLLAAIDHQETDRVPICFRGVAPLDVQWNSRFERTLGLQRLGVDDKLLLTVPWHHHPEVTIRQRWVKAAAQEHFHIVQEFETPQGLLRSVIRETQDYVPEDIPIRCDHTWSRGVDFPVRGREELQKLGYLFYDPTKADTTGFFESAARTASFAVAHGVLVEGSIAGYAGTLGNLVGPQRMLYLALDDRELIIELLNMIHVWSMKQLQLLLDAGVDTIYTSACYETVELWSPELVRELFHPLRREMIKVTHQAGAKLHYFTQTGIMPLILDYKEMGVDILSALDPLGVGGQRHAVDLQEVKETIGDTICLWGGVDPEHTIEMGTEDEVRKAVDHAIRTCAPGGGFVLSTSGSIYDRSEKTYRNVMAFIDAAHLAQ